MSGAKDIQWFNNPAYVTTKKINSAVSLIVLSIVPIVFLFLVKISPTFMDVAILAAVVALVVAMVHIAGSFRCPSRIGLSSEALCVVRGPFNKVTLIPWPTILSVRTKKVFPLFQESRHQVWILMKILSKSSLLDSKPVGFLVSDSLASRIAENLSPAREVEDIQVERSALDTPVIGFLLLTFGYPTIVLGIFFLWMAYREVFLSDEPSLSSAVVLVIVGIGISATGIMSVVHGYRLARKNDNLKNE